MARKQNELDACKARGFQKGSSANSKGCPPVIREVQEMAKSYTEHAVTTQHEIMTNKWVKGSARVQAAVAMLDREWADPSRAWMSRWTTGATGSRMPWPAWLNDNGSWMLSRRRSLGVKPR